MASPMFISLSAVVTGTIFQPLAPSLAFQSAPLLGAEVILLHRLLSRTGCLVLGSPDPLLQTQALHKNSGRGQGGRAFHVYSSGRGGVLGWTAKF